MDIHSVTIDKPEGLNVILGQSHFIKTLEDLDEVLAGASPQLRFVSATSCSAASATSSDAPPVRTRSDIRCIRR